MKRAAIGVRMHSGWGALVALSVDSGRLELLDRRRIVTIDSTVPGAFQPYHHAATLDLSDSERYLADYAALSLRLASAEVSRVLQDLDGYRILGCAVLLASGRPLPSLAKILASHPLVHTAEGEFFRAAVVAACEDKQIPITRIAERELAGKAKTIFGSAAQQTISQISTLAASMGPPWTKDHKNAALAAAMVLKLG